jgi:DNA (cytosine-5)-methyltransferase 1
MYYTVLEAAEKANCSIKTIRRAIAANEFAHIKLQNKIRIDKVSFDNWTKTGNKNELLEANFGKKNKKSPDVINWIDVSREMEKNYWNDDIKNRLNFIDLFSGAGGLGCGLVMAGFKPISSVEIMPEAIDTYKYNFEKFSFKKENLVSKDIRDPEIKESLYKSVLGKRVHLISGGFPCQGFSMAGHRIVTDPRNNLYTDMLEIVKMIKPDFVLMENVEGLRSMLGGMIEKKIIEDYKNIGYKINVTILNSADYGVPQLRKRVIFIGNRHNLVNYHPKPILDEKSYRTVKDAIYKFEEMAENPSINHIFTKHSNKTVNLIQELAPGKSLYSNYSDAWKKVHYELPSCTVKENHGGVNIHPNLPRVMTPRELAALQSFPDDFIFFGTKKWQLVQIGNAVPPLLAKAIGLSIKKSLKTILDMPKS